MRRTPHVLHADHGAAFEAPPSTPDLVRRLNAPARRDAIARARLLDRGGAAVFRRAVRLARRLLDAPVALVSIVKPDEQVFLAQSGLTEPWASRARTPLSHSFCKHVVGDDVPFVVTDATRHALVHDSPAVEELGIVAYCGVPLRAPDGAVVGALCAIDGLARPWTDEDVRHLEGLAEMAAAEIAHRLKATEADIFRDSAARRAEEAFRAAREMHHRVGNLFAVVLGVMALSRREEGDGPDTVRRIAARVHALSRVHLLGEASDHERVDLHALLSAFLRPYCADGRPRLIGSPVALSPEVVTPFSLALHEMLGPPCAPEAGRLSKLGATWRAADEQLHMTLIGRPGRTGAIPGTGEGSDWTAESAPCSALLGVAMAQLRGAVTRGPARSERGRRWHVRIPHPG